ncbi:HotDog domain-containing protein [Hypoxylon sp. NC1633]|nr:HotDog domain-containing protein [Hypoxylon sp. NC1633]
MPVGGPRAAQLLLCPRARLMSPLQLPRNIIAIRRPSTHLLQLHSPRLFTTSPRFSSTDPTIPHKVQEPVTIAATLPPRRRRRGLYYGAIFLLVGISLGTALRYTLFPPPLPTPGSAEDQYYVSRIRQKGLSLPLVRELSEDPSWTSWDAYSGIQSTTMVQSRITSGPLGGSRGLAFQRIFHNASTGEVVSVIYFGPATSGWHGVVHGGALATVLDESLGRCAILKFPARTGVTARLELSYGRPTYTGHFYVIRTRPVFSEGADPAKSDRKMWVEGTLETDKGKVCVKAKALFVVPKGVILKPLVEGF